MKQLIGRAAIKYNGKILLTEKGSKLNLGGVRRTPVTGDEVHGYTEEAVPAELECTFNVSNDTDLDEIKNLTNATITFEADNGMVWVMKEAVCSDPPVITAEGGGKVPGKFFAKRCDKL